MKSFSLDNRFEKNPEMPFRVIEDEVVLVPVKRNITELENGIFLLRDPVAFQIWQLIDGKRTIGEIQQAIFEMFQVDPSRLAEDLEEFVISLAEVGAIQRAEA